MIIALTLSPANSPSPVVRRSLIPAIPSLLLLSIPQRCPSIPSGLKSIFRRRQSSHPPPPPRGEIYSRGRNGDGEREGWREIQPVPRRIGLWTLALSDGISRCDNRAPLIKLERVETIEALALFSLFSVPSRHPGGSFSQPCPIATRILYRDHKLCLDSFAFKWQWPESTKARIYGRGRRREEQPRQPVSRHCLPAVKDASGGGGGGGGAGSKNECDTRCVSETGAFFPGGHNTSQPARQAGRQAEWLW